MKNKKIGLGTLVLMLMLSVLVDLVELVLDFFGIGIIAAFLIDPVVGFIYFVWFKFIGIKFDKSVWVSYIGGALLDLIPFVSALAWSLDVLGVYFSVKAQKNN